MTYYLQDNPNPNTPQYGWPRTRVSGVIGVHTTESGVVPSGPDGGAENTTRFIGNRSDYGSYHALADADSRIKLVHPSYAAWADTTNNVHAMSVSGAMDAARWRDLTPARAAAIVRNMAYAAAELVQDAIAAGLLDSPTPAVRISAAEAIAGSRPGFYGHGETNPGTRYDPGQNFDWDLFLRTYADAIGGRITTQGTTASEEDDMSADMPMKSKDGANVTLETVLNSIDRKVDGLPKMDAQFREQFTILSNFNRDVRAALEQSKAREETGNATIAALATTVAALSEGKDLSSEDILARVEAVVAKYAQTWTLSVQAGKAEEPAA